MEEVSRKNFSIDDKLIQIDSLPQSALLPIYIGHTKLASGKAATAFKGASQQLIAS